MAKPDPPAAPDPTQTIAAQTASNQSTATSNAELNRVNQYTPYGSSVYNVTGNNADGTPQYTQTTSLSPAQQNLLNMTQQGEQSLGQTALNSLGNVQNTYATPFSAAGLPQVTGNAGQQTGFSNPSGVGITGSITNGANDPQAIQQAENAAYNAQTQYLNPQIAQGQQSLNATLANEGLSWGDTGYNAGQQNFGNQANQAYQGAMNEAVSAGQNEQNTLFGQGLSAANLQNSANQQGYNQGLTSANFANSANLANATFQNQASGQSLQQALALYNQPLNQYNALATGAQVTNPSFGNVPSVNQQGTDVAGITNSAYQNQLSQYQQQQAGINNLYSLGGSLGAAAIMA